VFLFRYYLQLVEQIDKWTSEMTNRYKQQLACRKGCDLCCRRRFSVAAVEAYNIALAYRQLPSQVQQRVGETTDACAFLIEGACSIYESRPAICRTFGLPSLHRNEQEEAVISWCELNFTNTGEDFEFQADGIIDIDTLNTKIAGVNGLFLKESGLTVERIALEDVPKLDTSILESGN
jgi:Fe-S-cluster containining protein